MDQSANHVLLRGSQPGAADRMRDLLARTVQDHVSDQRSHASALQEIRKHLEGLEWLVKEVRQHELSDLSGQLAAQTEGLLRQLAEARENLPAWAELLPEHIRALSAQVRPVAELPALWADLGMVSENVDQVLPRLQALANRIDRLDDRIGDTDDRIGLINERIASIDDRIGSVDGRITALGDHLMAFGERLNGVHQVTARLSTLDERLSEALTPLTDELRLRPGQAEVEEVVAKVVSAAQAEMTARLDSLEETVLALAEALLRPVRHIADQRRDGERS